MEVKVLTKDRRLTLLQMDIWALLYASMMTGAVQLTPGEYILEVDGIEIEKPSDMECQDCEYFGRCEDDPQKADYCPLRGTPYEK